MKKGLILLILLFSLPIARAQFKVIPNTVGIGLQKNTEYEVYPSSDTIRCILYHLGNPWSKNVTGWLVVDGELKKFFLYNEPKEVFVPSGTFRYNSSCCLIPIKACFKFPYVLEDREFKGRVSSAFRVEDQKRPSGTGSAVGFSVAFGLTVKIKALKELVLKPGETKCIEIYEVGERCFKAPFFLFNDKVEYVEIDGHKIKLIYQNNRLILCVLICFVVGLLLSSFFLYRRFKRTRLNQQSPQLRSLNPHL